MRGALITVGPLDIRGDKPGDGIRTILPGQSGSAVARDLVSALANGAAVVVCDLTTQAVSASEAAEMFGPVARYLADWPGAGVVVVCPADAEAREGLHGLPLPATLLLSESADAGMARLSQLLPPVHRVEVQLAALLTSPRASRLFITRALLGWQLTPLVASVSLVVSELVTNSIVHATSSVHVTLSMAEDRVQLTVRDHGDGYPTAPSDDPDNDSLGGRGMLVVEESTVGWGVLAARPSGKTVWAVFDAAVRPTEELPA